MKNSLRYGALGLTGALLLWAAIAAVQQRVEGMKAPRVFLIGNSLTQGAYPKRLDGADYGRVQWHIYCAKNLRFIKENPAGHCDESSTPWPKALASGSYDFLSVQPFLGTTLEEDAAIIEGWAALQPRATLVVHTAWTYLAEFPAIYEANRSDGSMSPCPAYFDALVDLLRERLPGREIRTTNAHDILYAIYQDAVAGRGPFQSLEDFGADGIHLRMEPGRYLIHNAMRRALDQAPAEDVVELDSAMKAYLNEKLAAHGWSPPAE
ncbi:hypothetical protein [Alienimonas chondri]|uniref:hypothetical protein n=1 Tax=Alienimonas chondri TaxID=2681879 RepID=UPI001488FD3C|nr:hypothetical protein [Alienimonas chondri]